MYECFLTYAKQRYPLHESAEELKTIGDLTNIASWWVEEYTFLFYKKLVYKKVVLSCSRNEDSSVLDF